MNPVLKVLWWLDVKALKLFSGVPVKPNETISAALYELHRDRKWQGRFFMPIVDLLFRPWGREHCFQQWLFEQGRRKAADGL